MRKNIFLLIGVIVFQIIGGTLLGQSATSNLSTNNVDYSKRYFSEPISSVTVSQGVDLMNALARAIVGSLGYQLRDPAQPANELTETALKQMHLEKNIKGQATSIDLLLVKGVSGSFELAVTGKAQTNGIITGNPDLIFVRNQIKSLDKKISNALPLIRSNGLAMEVYSLSYSQTERVLGLLKALQYRVIEYGTTTFSPTEINGILSNNNVPQLPIIVQFIDTPSQNLNIPMETALFGSTGIAGSGNAPSLGGKDLPNETVGDSQEKLLIIYDPKVPESYQHLIDLLRNKIDVPAKQVLIEALVIEIDRNRAMDLGVNFNFTEKDLSGGFQLDSNGNQMPFTFGFDRFLTNQPNPARVFQSSITAMVQNGNAEILSKPSVLVLDGRQARIQIGQEIPIITGQTNIHPGGVNSIIASNTLNYLPVGIVLNLRPRISDDGRDITMQVEVVVSSTTNSDVIGSTQTVEPTIDSRHVQSIVRVADDTPFIIGGLIASDLSRTRSGLPGLSKLPVLGALFRKHHSQKNKKEVIIVLTPHVTSNDTLNIPQIIPKKTTSFDSFDNELFPNTYRFRGSDILDLSFVYESDAVVNLEKQLQMTAKKFPEIKHKEPFTTWFKGYLPGESILVRRMLWDIIANQNLIKLIDPKHMVYLDKSKSRDIKLSSLIRKMKKQKDHNTLALTFKSNEKHTSGQEQVLESASAKLSYEHINPKDYYRQLRKRNVLLGTARQSTILITEDELDSTQPLDILRGVVILKQILNLNPTLDLTLRDVHVGRQIVFPSRKNLSKDIFVIDEEIARYFYEIVHYFEAFDEIFRQESERLSQALHPYQADH